MNIGIRRTGGIAGIKAQLGPVDTVELGNGGLVVRKVQEINFFDLSAELPVANPVADGFHYAMTVEENERRHTVHYGDDSDAEAARPLFEVQKLLILNGCAFKWGSEQAVVPADGVEFTWEAWYNRMPGTHDPSLHVAGSCTLPSSSIQLVLEPDNPGIIPQPGVFALRLTIVRPGWGDDMMAEKHVVWSGDVGPDIEWVEIRGDAEAKIPVTDIH
jgi:hypothetical protein